MLNVKGLSIELLLWVMRMGFWRLLGIEGIGITFCAPPYPKIGGGRIYIRFSCARGLLLTFAPLYMLGFEPETCGDRTVKGLLGRYSPVSMLNVIIESSSEPWHEDLGDPVPFTGFSVVDYLIPTNPHKTRLNLIRK